MAEMAVYHLRQASHHHQQQQSEDSKHRRVAMGQMEALTAELLDKKYLFPGFGQESAQWEASRLVRVYQRLLSVHSDAFDYEEDAPGLSRHLAHICRCLRLLEIGHLAPKLQDLTDKSRALRIISALDDKISAKYKAHMAARRVRVVMRKEDQKGKTLKPKPRPPAAQEETVAPERVKFYYPETPETQKHMIPSGQQLQRTPVAQEGNDTGQPAVCRYESIASSVSPSYVTRNNESQAAITTKDRSPAPTTSNNERVAPITSNSESSAPITSSNERVAPITSNSESLASITSNNERMTPVTSNSESSASITSNNERVAAIISNNDSSASITSNNERMAPITSNSESSASITSTSESPAFTTINSGSPAFTTINSGSPAFTTVSNGRSLCSNSDSLNTSINGSPVFTITSNDGSLISNSDSPTASNGSLVSTITSNNERMAPITNNSECPAITTINSGRPAFTTVSNDRSLSSNSDTPTTSNGSPISTITSNDGSPTSNRDGFSTSKTDSPAFTFINHESLISNSQGLTTSNERSPSTTSCNESLLCGSNSDITYIVPTKTLCSPSRHKGMDVTLQKDRNITYVVPTDDKHSGHSIHKETNMTFQNDADVTYSVSTDDKHSGHSSHNDASMTFQKDVDDTYCLPMTDKYSSHSNNKETNVTFQKDVHVTYSIPTYDKHCSHGSHKEINITFQKDDVTDSIPTNNQHCGHCSHRETDMTIQKDVDSTHSIPTTDKHCGHSSHKETNVAFQKDVDVKCVVPSNKPLNEANDDNKGMENDESALNDTVVKMVDNTLLLAETQNERLFLTSDCDDSLEIFPHKDKASQKAELRGEAKKKSECTLANEPVTHAKTSEKSNRNERKRQGDAKLQAEVFGASVEEDNCGTTEERLNSTAHHEDDSKRKSGVVTEASVNSEEGKLTDKETVLKLCAGTKKSGKKDAKAKSKKYIDIDEGSKEVKPSSCPKKNSHKNTEVTFDSCYEEEEKENIVERKDVKLRGQAKKKTQVKPLEEILQRSKYEIKAATEKAKTIEDMIDNESNLKRGAIYRKGQRVKGKESCVDTLDDIFLKSNRNKAKNVKRDTVDLENTMVDDFKKKAVKSQERRRAIHKQSFGYNETETEDAKAAECVKLETEEPKNTIADDIEMKTMKSRGRRRRVVLKKLSSDDDTEIEDAKAPEGVQLETDGAKNTMPDDIEMKTVKSRGRRQRAVLKKFSNDDEIKTEYAKMNIETAKGVQLETEGPKNTLADDVKMKAVKSRGRRQRTVLKKFSSDDDTEIQYVKTAPGVKLDTEELENTVAHTCDIERKAVISRGRRRRAVLKKLSSDDDVEIEYTKAAQAVKLNSEELENTVVHTRELETKAVKSKGKRWMVVHKKSASHDETDKEDAKINVTAAEGVTIETEELKNTVAHDVKMKGVKSKARRWRTVHKKLPSDDEAGMDDTMMSVVAAEGVKLHTGDPERTLACDIKKKAMKSSGRRRAAHKKSPSDSVAEMDDTKMSVKADEGLKSVTDEFESTVTHGIEKKAVKSKGRRKAIHKKSPSGDGTDTRDAKINVTTFKSDSDETKVKGRKGKGKTEKINEEEPCVEVLNGRRCKSRAMAAIQAMLQDSFA